MKTPPPGGNGGASRVGLSASPDADRDGEVPWREFESRWDGMRYAMSGGLWLHRHVWKGEPMAHLVSTSRERLLAYGEAIGLPASRLQYKPLKDPDTGVRRPAWHWDLGGPYLPGRRG